MINIKCVPVTGNAKLPTKAHASDAAFDIYTDVDVIVSTRVTVVTTGIAIEIPQGYFGKLESRSGLSRDFGLQVLGAITDGAVRFGGVIDAGYRGEVKVLLATYPGMGNKAFKAGDAVAQLLILPVVHADCQWVDNLSDTERGEAGFGSTDVPISSQEEYDYAIDSTGSPKPGEPDPWLEDVTGRTTRPASDPTQPDLSNPTTNGERSPESTPGRPYRYEELFDEPLPEELLNYDPNR